MAEITKEIVIAALESDEALQYVSLSNALKSGKVLNSDQQRKYDAYKKKIEVYMTDGKEPDQPDVSDEIGIPEKLRVKRRYTMTPEALEQRKKAGNSQPTNFVQCLPTCHAGGKYRKAHGTARRIDASLTKPLTVLQLSVTRILLQREDSCT